LRNWRAPPAGFCPVEKSWGAPARRETLQAQAFANHRRLKATAFWSKLNRRRAWANSEAGLEAGNRAHGLAARHAVVAESWRPG
jgi:hypothetical protein